MAAIKHFKGAKILIKVEDPDTPGTYNHYCSVNADRGITFTANGEDSEEIDCDDVELVAWITREKVSLSVEVEGGGTVNSPDVLFFFNYWKSAASRNCQIVMDVPAADGGLIFAGKFHLMTFGIQGARTAKSQGTVSWVSDGEVTASPNT